MDAADLHRVADNVDLRQLILERFVQVVVGLSAGRDDNGVGQNALLAIGVFNEHVILTQLQHIRLAEEIDA